MKFMLVFNIKCGYFDGVEFIQGYTIISGAYELPKEHEIYTAYQAPPQSKSIVISFHIRKVKSHYLKPYMKLHMTSETR